jgi:TonB family protein
MYPHPKLRWLFWVVLGLASLVRCLQAQNVLYAEDGDQYRLVRRVVRNTAYVEDTKGKLVPARGLHYSLRKVEEFAPIYISVRNMRAHSEYLELMESGHAINNNFYYQAEFEAPYPLEDVFLVLDLTTEHMGRVLFVQEIGRMVPRETRSIDVVVPLNDTIGAGKYQLHLFCGGAEVFHSEMPFGKIEHELDKIVARQIKGITDAPPKPFVGPAPEYPAKLKKAKVEGKAIIHFTISPRGRIVDPAVKSATDPAFGESALAAARQWRFLPRIVNGQPVATNVDMPFLFSAAPPSAAQPAG